MVLPLVRVAMQVAEVLHEDEGRIALALKEVLIFSNRAEHCGARRRAGV